MDDLAIDIAYDDGTRLSRFNLHQHEVINTITMHLKHIVHGTSPYGIETTYIPPEYKVVTRQYRHENLPYLD